MPFAMESLTKALAVLGCFPPQSLAAGTDTSVTNIDISKVRRLIAYIQTGTLGASATLDVKLRASKTSGGTYTDITGAAITQIVKASGDNKIATIEVRDDQLESIVGAGYRYVQISITVGTASSQVGVLVLGGDAEFKPANANDISAVVQRVVT